MSYNPQPLVNYVTQASLELRVAQAGLELLNHPPQPPACWDYRHVPLLLDHCFLNIYLRTYLPVQLDNKVKLHD
jgi:hypothetical protein